MTQPDSIVPEPGNPQALNRYAYALNNPIRYIDPTGHRPIIDEDEYGNPIVDPDWSPRKKHDGGGREPGEPRCKDGTCDDDLQKLLTIIAWDSDAIAWGISAAEAIVADVIYLGAGAVCVGTESIGCGPAFGVAWEMDMAIANFAGPLENNLGYLSFGATAFSDWRLGNIGYDKDVGVYVGRDSVVSFRNSVIGSLPESNLDFLVSHSQYNYDLDRFSGEKTGGYVQVFSFDFLGQMLFKDWW